MFIRSPGEPIFAQVVGHSEHGDAYRRITYDRDGKTVLHNRASVRLLSLPRAPSPYTRAMSGRFPPMWGSHKVTFPPWGGGEGGGGGLHHKILPKYHNVNQLRRLQGLVKILFGAFGA